MSTYDDDDDDGGVGFDSNPFEARDDYGDDDNLSPQAAPPDGGDGQENAHRATLAYLLRYETMVRQQDAEEMATVAHLRPLFFRIRSLGGGGSGDDNEEDNDSAVLSYGEIGRALNVLEEESSGVGRSDQADVGAGVAAPPTMDDGGGGGVRREVMVTDRQLMMVLRTISEMLRTTDAAAVADANVDGGGGGGGLTFPEFLHAYRTVIGGMQTLQMLPSSSSSSSSNHEGGQQQQDDDMTGEQYETAYHRSRTRDRTLSMLKLFGPTDGGAFSSSSATPQNLRTVGSGEEEEEEEMRRMLTLKDRQLVKIIEDHTGEIDEIADRVLELNELDKVRLRQKRRRTRLLTMLGIMAVLVAGLVWVLHFRVSDGGTPTTMTNDTATITSGKEKEEERDNNPEECKKKISELEGLLSKSQSEIETLQKRESSHKVQMNELKQTLSNKTSTLQATEQELNILEHTNFDLRRKINKNVEEMEKTRTEVQSCREEMRSKSNLLEKQRAVIVAKEEELWICKKKLERATATTTNETETTRTGEEEMMSSNKAKHVERERKRDEWALARLELRDNRPLRSLMQRREFLAALGGGAGMMAASHVIGAAGKVVRVAGPVAAGIIVGGATLAVLVVEICTSEVVTKKIFGRLWNALSSLRGGGATAGEAVGSP